MARKPHGDPAGGGAMGAATGTVEDVVDEVALIGGAVDDVLSDAAGSSVVVMVDGTETAPDATVGPWRPTGMEQLVIKAATTRRRPGSSQLR